MVRKGTFFWSWAKNYSNLTHVYLLKINNRTLDTHIETYNPFFYEFTTIILNRTTLLYPDKLTDLNGDKFTIRMNVKRAAEEDRRRDDRLYLEALKANSYSFMMYQFGKFLNFTTIAQPPGSCNYFTDVYVK